MSNETNPFRLSMLQRSESPFDAEALEISANAIQFPGQSAGPHPPPSRAAPHDPSLPSSNPFRVELSEPPAEQLLEPPSYYSTEVRRHSDPNISDEKSRLAADDSYREGYERGMRMARERERERQRRRRERGERSDRGDRGERHSDRQRSERHSDREYPSSSGYQQNRQRSKSESASRGSYRSSSQRQSSSSRKHHHSKANNASLDVIDKMDVTGFYGPGTFHHDGPFDACTPHRNKATSRGTAAPIAAFPADGPNNSLAVEDPGFTAFRKEEEVYGRQVQLSDQQQSFDPTDRAQPVHGQRTMGLGTSTFIDGTPASRDAIEQAGRERAASFGRSKSLLRRPSAARRPSPQVAQRHASDPDRDYGSPIDERDEDQPKMSLLSRVRSLRASGRH